MMQCLNAKHLSACQESCQIRPMDYNSTPWVGSDGPFGPAWGWPRYTHHVSCPYRWAPPGRPRVPVHKPAGPGSLQSPDRPEWKGRGLFGGLSRKERPWHSQGLVFPLLLLSSEQSESRRGQVFDVPRSESGWFPAAPGPTLPESVWSLPLFPTPESPQPFTN